MKLSNLSLTAKNNRVESALKFDWLSPDLPTLITIGILFTMIVIALEYKQQNNLPETKTLAWYMANPKAALDENRYCFQNPQLKQSENCINSLHALEVMHKGPNS